MAFTYDATLLTDRDWVRFYVPDKVAAVAIYQDEEIDALIAEQMAKGRTGLSAKYYASASALRNLVGEYALVGGGLRRKEVDDLELEFGFQTASSKALQDKIDFLEKEGNKCLVPRPKLIQAMGSVSPRHFHGVHHG